VLSILDIVSLTEDIGLHEGASTISPQFTCWQIASFLPSHSWFDRRYGLFVEILKETSIRSGNVSAHPVHAHTLHFKFGLETPLDGLSDRPEE
jgi:hypothetical protein